MFAQIAVIARLVDGAILYSRNGHEYHISTETRTFRLDHIRGGSMFHKHRIILYEDHT